MLAHSGSPKSETLDLLDAHSPTQPLSLSIAQERFSAFLASQSYPSAVCRVFSRDVVVDKEHPTGSSRIVPQLQNMLSSDIKKISSPSRCKFRGQVGWRISPARRRRRIFRQAPGLFRRFVHDKWAEDDPTYVSCSDGRPRILSRLKMLLETGKTFEPRFCELGSV